MARTTAITRTPQQTQPLTREQGCDLRSRCQLFPTQAFVWELLDAPGEAPKQYGLTGEQAVVLFNEAVAAAKKAKLPWRDDPLELKPSPELIELVRRSQELAAQGTEDE
jgi:CRISPR-associated protein Csb1